MPAQTVQQEQQEAILTVEHLPGCPVRINPDLLHRVEQYTVAKSDMDTRSNARLAGKTMVAVHCTECGAITYHERG